VCDGCSDGTPARCRARTDPYRLVVVELDSPGGPAAARNRGIDEAAGTVIVFIDDDVVPDPQLLAQHLAVHETDPMAVVMGPLLAPERFQQSPWTQWEAEMLERQYRDIARAKWSPSARQFYTGNASVKRSHLASVGGFDTGFRRAEDIDLAYRLKAAGLNFRFAETAKAWHQASRSLASWLRIPRLYGEADVAMHRAGRARTLNFMAWEFNWRRPQLRKLASLCVGRRPIVAATTAGLLCAGAVCSIMRGRAQAMACYSAVFNLNYWQSISDALGGRKAFWDLIESERWVPGT